MKNHCLTRLRLVSLSLCFVVPVLVDIVGCNKTLKELILERFIVIEHGGGGGGGGEGGSN